MKDNKAIVIHSENKDIFIFSSNPFSIKSLKKRIAKELEINEESIVLMDESKVLEDNEILDIKENNDKFLMYIKKDFGENQFMKMKENDETISSLIMKVTGGKTQLEQKNVRKNRNNQINSTSQILNDIFSNSPLIFPGISTNSVRVRQELQNFFLPLINQQYANNNELSQSNQENQNNAPNNMNVTVINLSQPSSSGNVNNQSTNNQQGQQNIRLPFPFIQQSSIVVDEDKVKTLSELGFSDENSRKALLYCANDLDAAAELCISGRVDELPSHPNIQTFIFPLSGSGNSNNNQEDQNNND